MTEQLAHKERIAVRLTMQGVSKPDTCLVELIPSRGFDEIDDLPIRETGHHELLYSRLTMQFGEQSRQCVLPCELAVAVRSDDHERSRAAGPRDVAQQPDGRGVGPVQVIENEHHGAVGSRVCEQRNDGFHQQQTPGVPVASDDVARGQPGTVTGQQPCQRTGIDWRKRRERLRRGMFDELAQRRHPRSIRHHEVLAARTEEHNCALRVRGACSLRDQCGLPDTGFTADETQPGAPVTRRFLDRGRDEFEFHRPAEEREQALIEGAHELRRQWHRANGRGIVRHCWFPTHLDDRYRLRKTFELSFADGCEFVHGVTADDRPHHLGREDLPAVRLGTKARGLDHGFAEVVAVFFDDLADRQPDTDRQRNLVPAIMSIDRLLHRHCAGKRAGWTREHDHEAITEILHDDATGRRRGILEQTEMGLAERFSRLTVKGGCERGRTHKVREQQRDRLRICHPDPRGARLRVGRTAMRRRVTGRGRRRC
jgi:hypothetical protein